MKDIAIGIIGGTKGMGKWFADFLKRQGYIVHVSGRTSGMGAAEMAATCQIIVISVPIGITAEIIAEIGPLMNKEQLLMDLTSLKVAPVEAMLKFSPAEVIGCHPLFGPQVGEEEKKHIILCPARGEKWLPWLMKTLKEGGALIMETTPERHDELMSVVQGLNHLNTLVMGMALGKTSAPLSQLDRFTTPFFEAKVKMVEKIFTDNPRLYGEIICHNEKMKGIIEIYEQILAEVKSKILKHRAEELTDMMEKTAARLWPPRK